MQDHTRRVNGKSTDAAQNETRETGMSLFARYLRDTRGATAVEYAFMVMLIAIVIVASVRAVGTGLQSRFNAVAVGFS